MMNHLPLCFCLYGSGYTPLCGVAKHGLLVPSGCSQIITLSGYGQAAQTPIPLRTSEYANKRRTLLSTSPVSILMRESVKNLGLRRELDCLLPQAAIQYRGPDLKHAMGPLR
jgi:hypothetical protein